MNRARSLEAKKTRSISEVILCECCEKHEKKNQESYSGKDSSEILCSSCGQRKQPLALGE